MAQSSQRPPENDDELPPLNIGVAATIKAKKTSFEAFAKAVADPEFQEQLDKAVLNPEGDDAKKVIERIFKFARLSSSRVPWGEGERAAEVTTSMAVHRTFGPANYFFSAAPDDTHDFLESESYPHWPRAPQP